MSYKMPIPTRAECLNKGAAYIEQELHRMREKSVNAYEASGLLHAPITTSHEGDLMWAVELATAATTLRMLAKEAE